MPKRFARRRSSGGKRRVVRGRRRLTSASFHAAPPYMGFTSPGVGNRYATAMPSAPRKKKLKAKRRHNATATAGGSGPFARGMSAEQYGKNTVPPQSRGSYKRSGSVKRGIKRQIMDALVYGSNPILKSDIKLIPAQIDWASGTQAHVTYVMGNTPADIEKKFAKCRDASYFNAAVAYPVTTTDVASQRMVVFPSTFIANMKNTCSHTCYIEARVYKAKGYHTTSSSACFQESLLYDNVVQNPNTAPYPTEETFLSLYKRPDMKSPYLNCRWGEVLKARAKWILEPGQETKFIFKMPGFSYDQARYNVLVGGSDPTRCPQTYEVQLFCHAEMVTGALDNDVCPGSGHIAVNTQSIESWQALPVVKKFQNIASYGWGDIVQADEQDINPDDIQAETYFENE